MDNKISRFTCTLLLMSAIFNAARYIGAAVLAGGSADKAVYETALDILGPFLPAMALICLGGGFLLLVVELVLTHRNKKG